VEFPKVQTRVKNGLDSASLYKQKIPPIYYNFTRSVNSYDKAVKLFASVSNQYESIEDLYLLFDEALDAKLSQLKMDYDSSIYYFNQYQALIKEYPIKYHRQTYTVKPIETFRLDGFITRLTFLTDKVEFWDYSTWVELVRKSVANNIKDLRAKLNEAETKLQESIVKANSGSDFKPYPLSKQLILDLNNVDKESAVLSLLHYQNYIQNWLYATKTFRVDTANSERNTVAYSNFIHQNRHADTLVREMAAKITDLKVAMHHDFVGKFFGSKSALEKYVTDQTTMISQTYQQYATSLRNAVMQNNDSVPMIRNKENVVRFGGRTIPLRILPMTVDDLNKGLLITQFNQKNPDGSAYLAGLYRPDKKINNNVVFVARITPDGKVAWLNPFNPKIDTTSLTSDANQSLGPAIVTPEGIALVVRSEHLTNGSKVNTFFYLNNEKGEPKVKFTLLDYAYPRFLKYHEKLNAFVFILKGAEEKLNFSIKEDATLMCVNVLKDVLWKKIVPLTGTITDVTTVTDGLMLSGNFMTITDSRGNEVRTKVNVLESNPYLLKVGEKGELTPMPISVPFSFYLTKLVRVNDNSINLLGTKENFETGIIKPFNVNDPVLHIMSTKSGQIIYTNY
jgi:hypothetical protein